MKLNEEMYAVVDEDGTVVGDGECPIISSSREVAEMGLTIAREVWQDRAGNMRVAKVILIEKMTCESFPAKTMAWDIAEQIESGVVSRSVQGSIKAPPSKWR